MFFFTVEDNRYTRYDTFEQLQQYVYHVQGRSAIASSSSRPQYANMPPAPDFLPLFPSSSFGHVPQLNPALNLTPVNAPSSLFDPLYNPVLDFSIPPANSVPPPIGYPSYPAYSPRTDLLPSNNVMPHVNLATSSVSTFLPLPPPPQQDDLIFGGAYKLIKTPSTFTIVDPDDVIRSVATRFHRCARCGEPSLCFQFIVVHALVPGCIITMRKVKRYFVDI